MMDLTRNSACGINSRSEVDITMTETETNNTTYTVNYVDKDALADELRDYYDTDVPTDTLGLYLMAIVQGVLQSASWRGYSQTWKDDLYDAAILDVWRAVEKKQVKPETAFQYIERITWNAFRKLVGCMKARELAGLEYRDYKRHVGECYVVDEEVGHDKEADNDLYEYCCSDH